MDTVLAIQADNELGGTYQAASAAVKDNLRAKSVTVNPASQVKIALWIYAFLVAWVTERSWSIYAHYPTFDTRPVFDKRFQFCDLTYYIGKTAHLYHGSAALGRGMPVFNYPPPAAFVYKILLYTIPAHAVRFYLSFLVICICGFALMAWRACRASPAVRLSAAAAILTTAALGYPLWFTVDRANIEGVVWAVSGAGLCFLLRARYRTAAVLIGLAASIKPFALLFLLLLLPRRRYKEVGLGLLTAGLLIFAALIAIGPNPWKAYQDLKPGGWFYMDHYVMNLTHVGEARFSHSLLDGMKSAALSVEMGGVHPVTAITEVPKLMAERGGWHGVRPLVQAYRYIAIAGFALLLATFYKSPILNQLTALGVAVTLFPPVASDYSLLHLYVPFGALLIFLVREVAAGKATLRYTSMLSFAVIYALLFAPLSFLRIYAGDAKLLLLLALLVVAARSPIDSEYFSDPEDGVVTGANRKDKDESSAPVRISPLVASESH